MNEWGVCRYCWNATTKNEWMTFSVDNKPSSVTPYRALLLQWNRVSDQIYNSKDDREAVAIRMYRLSQLTRVGMPAKIAIKLTNLVIVILFRRHCFSYYTQSFENFGPNLNLLFTPGPRVLVLRYLFQYNPGILRLPCVYVYRVVVDCECWRS